MSWNTLRTQIATLLDTISTIHEVASYPKLEWSGYPAAYVVPSGQSGEYETTTENVRTYAFTVRVFYDTQTTGVSGALDKLEGVIDTVLDTFDQEDLKGSSSRTIGLNLPSGYTFLNIFAHPSSWGEVQGENLIFAEIEVRVRLSRDIT